MELDSAEPTLDLSEASVIEPGGLVYLGTFLRHSNRLGKFVDTIAPRAPAAREHLESQKIWERYGSPYTEVEWDSVPACERFSFPRGFMSIESDYWIADKVGDMVAEMLRANSVRVSVDPVAEAVIELVDNFARHSGEPLAACGLELDRSRGRLHFAVGECGVGIRGSLARNPRYADLSGAPHHVSAAKAMEDGVAGSSEGGTGLGTVRENVMELGGQMLLSTGDGWVGVQTGRQDIQAGAMGHDLPGVQVQVTVPVEV